MPSKQHYTKDGLDNAYGDSEVEEGNISHSSRYDTSEELRSTKKSKKEGGRSSHHTVGLDEEFPSSGAFTVKKTTTERASRNRVCYLIFALLCLVGVGFGVYLLLDWMGWLPHIQKNAAYQGTVSMFEVAVHDTADDCWIVYHNQVYVMTEYAKVHPGGASIITGLCGADGTALFEIYHPQSLLKSVKTELLGDLNASGNVNGETSGTVNAGGGSTGIALSDVSTHNQVSDCWVVFYNQVYDMTEYSGLHPGGSAYITGQCGADGTSAYAAIHPESLLSTATKYLLGDLIPSNLNVNGETGGTVDVGNTGSVSNGIALSEVSAHNQVSDCWVVFYNQVYDMTEYPGQHRGGSAVITDHCGADGTSAYTAIHPESLLGTVQKYLLGNLASDGSGGSSSSSSSGNGDAGSSSSSSDDDDGDDDSDSGYNDSDGQSSSEFAVPPPVQSPTPTQTTVSEGTESGILLSEVGTHNTVNDCWIIYHDQVYDMTTYAEQHPGGSSIIQINCGDDGTSSFDSKHPLSYLDAVQQFLKGDLAVDGSGASGTSNSSGNAPVQAPVSAPVQVPTCSSPDFTIADVQQHDNAGDCWTVYHGSVYEMTGYQHVGSFITQQCGQDGTSNFDLKHPYSFLNLIRDRELGLLSDVACP